ncbi:MAG TPA: pitrilysin family protein [Afifellaceae bacterium]|nr:pitrilysin family protein [Afifellaceae bacterium]
MSVEQSRLANGLTVVTHRMPHLESVALGVWFEAGSRSEAPHEHGISHLLEHMAFKGTARRSARDIAETIEAVGGDMNAATSVDHTGYYVRLLKEHTELGVDILGDILCHSAFDPQELAREQHVIVQEIGAARDDPEELAFDLFQEAAYPGQPIGRTILGSAETVRSFTPADLRRFLATHYRGARAVLSAAGNLDHGQIVAWAEEHLAELPAEAPPSPAPGTYRGGRRVEKRKLEEVQLLLGFEGLAFRDPELFAARLLAGILGGGMASRLFQEVREARGLCYAIQAFDWPFADSGIFGIQAAAGEADVGQLVSVVLDELRRVDRGIAPAELARAKAQLRASLLMSLESPAARAGQMARHVLIHGRPLGLEEVVERIEAVSARQVADLARSVFATPPTVAGVGPAGALPRPEDVARQLAGTATV